MNARGALWSLRLAAADDAAPIARFHVASWTDAYRGIVPEHVLSGIDPAERAIRWQRRLADRRRSTVVAESGGGRGHVVGFATWGESHDPPEPALPTLEVASLYVARELWGTGLAAALLEYATEGAAAHLWVYEANGRARRFYEKHGFAPDGRAQVDERAGAAECRYVRR